MENLQQMIGEEFLSIPVKITDGIFMSDNNIARDVDWLETNQVSHIVNCAGKHCQNLNKSTRLSFLTFDWNQATIQNLLDQNVIGSSVNFIEQARRQSGTVLLHYYQSESRPFCILAAYFMIKYQWNLFKTLEFLNSRRQDIELQPNFFEQLTTLHQKLHDKGLIKSRNWVVTEGMNEDEVILTNTFLNSQKRNSQHQHTKNKEKNRQLRQINWKNNLIMQHIYSPSSTIAMPDKRPSSVPRNKQNQYNGNMIKEQKEPKEKNEILRKIQTSQVNQQTNSNQIQGKVTSKTHLVYNEKPSAPADMNVTKKWNDLRETWIREKQNFSNNVSNINAGMPSEVTDIARKQQTSAIARNDIQAQRISDRLQDKLTLLKNHQNKIDMNSKVRSKQPKQLRDSNKQNQKQNTRTDNKSQNSRILHNNWIINNQVFKQGQEKKQTKQQPSSNKSVIIVKPNHFGNGTEDARQNARGSIRKVSGSQRKRLDKDQSGSEAKFFRNDSSNKQNTPLHKARSNSAKPQRKEIQSAVMLKNSSFGMKGKWKF